MQSAKPKRRTNRARRTLTRQLPISNRIRDVEFPNFGTNASNHCEPALRSAGSILLPRPCRDFLSSDIRLHNSWAPFITLLSIILAPIIIARTPEWACVGSCSKGMPARKLLPAVPLGLRAALRGDIMSMGEEVTYGHPNASNECRIQKMNAGRKGPLVFPGVR